MKDWKEKLGALEPEGIRPRTLTELYGNERLLVEQHRGILGYGTECIRIAATFGVLAVEGVELRLCCMSRSQLVIRGKILSIRLEA